MGSVVYLTETNSILRATIELDALLLRNATCGPEKIIDGDKNANP